MTTPAFLRWCPQCQRATENAPLPQMSDDSRRLRRIRPGAPEGYSRRLYCLACSQIWGSVELPEEYIHQLLGQSKEIEELRRELAMARLLLAKEQQPAEKSKSPRRSVKMRAA